jgi:ABC-2 type transport system permease protein
MSRILGDLRAFGIQYLRSRVGTFFALAFPIILILMFGAIFSGGGTNAVPLYVQDLDNTPTSHAFLSALNNTTVLEIHMIPGSPVKITDYISANSINTALLIPTGFETNVSAAAKGNRSAVVNLTLYGDPTQSTYGIAVAAVNGAATAFNFAIARATPVVRTNTASIATQNPKYIDLFLPGIIGFTVLTTPLFGMTTIAADYRQRRYFKFLATTKLSKAEWLASKVLFNIVLMFASVGLMLLTGYVVFHADDVLTPVAALLIIVGTLQFTSLGMILGIFVRDGETAAAIANAVGFPMMFLAGTFFPIDLFPPFLKSVAYVLPLTYVTSGLRSTMLFGNTTSALTDLLITVVIAIVLFIIPARALSWKSK